MTRPKDDKTCLGCGRELTGRQRRWCGAACERLYAAHLSRRLWARYVKQRDQKTCKRCGWKHTAIKWRFWREAMRALKKRNKTWSFAKLMHEACKITDYRILEAHHIIPLEHGGPELDVDNGMTLCASCHDQQHRELNKAYAGR